MMLFNYPLQTLLDIIPEIKFFFFLNFDIQSGFYKCLMSLI